jgi:hypothetical protein
MTPDPFRRLSRIMCEALELHLKEGARPRVPDAGAILWRCFADLCEARRFGPSGPDPISLAEILAWAELHKMPFGPRHVLVIRDLDRVWLKDATAKPEAQPLTPQGFDAVFG